MNSNQRPLNRRPSPRAARRRRNRRLALAGIGLALILVIALVIFLVFRSCQRTGPLPSEQNSSVAITTTTAATTTVATTAAVTTAAPTTAATTTTIPDDNTVNDSWFDDALFIGDSRTEAFMNYAAPGQATFYATRGLSVKTVFENKFVKVGNDTLTVNDALGKQSFGKVYTMLGVNELGWGSPEAFIKRYGDLIDRIQATQPGAAIFVQAILPVSAERDAKGDYVNNGRIVQFNGLIETMCKEKKVTFLKVGEAVADSEGKLPAEATTDGVHLNKTYCLKWLDYLKSHTAA